MSARLCITEPGPTNGPGAMGARLLEAALVDAGHEVRFERWREGTCARSFALPPRGSVLRPQAIMVSCVYVRQWLHLPALLRYHGIAPLAADRTPGDPLVVLGGQAMIAPEAVAPFADVLALGDGEVTGVRVAELLARGATRAEVMRELVGQPGFYVPLEQQPPAPFVRVELESTIPTRVVRPGEKGSPTLELARGCRSRCAFCPIGWAGGSYREGSREGIEAAIGGVAGKPVNLFAPDFSSVSWATEAESLLARSGCRPKGRDARMDATARLLAAGGHAREYNFGVEGLSERLRAGLGKPLAAAAILDVMRQLSGHAREVKWYLIVGLPGETESDREELLDLVRETRSVFTGRLTLSPTPLQSVPHTPLERVRNLFDQEAYDFVMRLRAQLAAEDTGDPHVRVLCTQPKGRELHEHDAWLQRGDRRWAGYLLASTWGSVSSGRWRDHAAAAGVPSADEVLRELSWEKETPWDHVEVGSDRRARRAAWETYARRAGLRRPCTPLPSASPT